MDSIVIFSRLAGAEIRKIVELRLREVQQRLVANGRDVTIDVSEAAKDWLGAAGVSPAYGARPLVRRHAQISDVVMLSFSDCAASF